MVHPRWANKSPMEKMIPPIAIGRVWQESKMKGELGIGGRRTSFPGHYEYSGGGRVTSV